MRLSSRGWRRVAWIAFSVIVIVVASVAYLQSSRSSTTTTASQSINPLFVTRDTVSYDFVTPTSGWALDLATGPTATPGRYEVFRTVDGARHWQLQFAGQSSVSGFVPVSIQSFDKSHAFMTIGRPVEHLYRTADGGAHWIAVPLLSVTIDAIRFSDASNGWLSGSLTSAVPVSRLFVTHDAGDSWQGLPDLPAGSDRLALRRSSDAWLGSYGPRPPRVYRSSNGGVTWQPRDIPYPPPVVPGAVYPPNASWDASVSLLPVSGVIASVSCACAPTNSYDFTSFDGGTTWSLVPPPPGLVAYEDDSHWWVINARTLSKSSDAGQTWTMISDQLPDWQYVPHVLDSKHAWALLFVVGGYGLALTNDGGLHWTRATVPQQS
jgi:photosystem II stability/assembly factor-like uncharacterized protein